MRVVFKSRLPYMSIEELPWLRVQSPLVPLTRPIVMVGRVGEEMVLWAVFYKGILNLELVDEILSTLHSKDLSNTIYVNYLFFAASKRILWRNISLKNALNLLGPTHFPPYDDNYRFINAPTHEAWKRFFEYATHVRTLIGSGTDALALWDAVRSLPKSPKNLGVDSLEYLFPGCRIFEWHGTEELEVVNIDELISPNLESFSLEGWDASSYRSPWFRHLSSTLITRLSNLRVLHLDIGQFLDLDASSQNLDPYLALLTRFSETLTSVALPGALATTATFRKLFQIKNLSSLRFYHGNTTSTSSQNDPSDDGSDLPEILPSLKHFSFDALVPPMTAFNFCCIFSLSSLRTLRWSMLEVPDNICDLFATIASKCPELELLELGKTDNPSVPIFPWADIRPILGCSKLAYLDLHCCRVNMTLDDYTELVRSRKKPTVWRVLQVFTSERFHFPKVLSIFAKYSPGIQALGLHVYVNEDIDPFYFISPMHLPLYKLPRIGNLWRYLKAQLELEEITQRPETLLPCLTFIDFSASPFVTDWSAVPTALLLLALCRNPVYIKGWGPELKTISNIYERTANYFMDLEKQTNKPMSPAAEKYVDFYRNKFRNWEFNPIQIACMFHNLHNYANIEFPS